MTAASKPKLLIADDQQDVLEALRLLLKGENYLVQTAMSPPATIEALKSGDFDALLMDLNYTRDTTSGEEGLELIRQVRVLAPELSIVVMTAWGTIEVAVEAQRRSARQRALLVSGQPGLELLTVKRLDDQPAGGVENAAILAQRTLVAVVTQIPQRRAEAENDVEPPGVEREARVAAVHEPRPARPAGRSPPRRE